MSHGSCLDHSQFIQLFLALYTLQLFLSSLGPQPSSSASAQDIQALTQAVRELTQVLQKKSVEAFR